MRPIRLGRVAGLEVSCAPSAMVSSAVLWAAVVTVALVVFRLGAIEALAGGLAVTLLHWVAELLHNIGHSLAARAVGRPMTGVQFYLLVGRSQYPADETGVTPGMHIRRALGGPALSAAVTVIAGLLTLGLVAAAVRLAWVGLLFFLDNLLVFALGPAPRLSAAELSAAGKVQQFSSNLDIKRCNMIS